MQRAVQPCTMAERSNEFSHFRSFYFSRAPLLYVVCFDSNRRLSNQNKTLSIKWHVL